MMMILFLHASDTGTTCEPLHRQSNKCRVVLIIVVPHDNFLHFVEVFVDGLLRFVTDAPTQRTHIRKLKHFRHHAWCQQRIDIVARRIWRKKLFRMRSQTRSDFIVKVFQTIVLLIFRRQLLLLRPLSERSLVRAQRRHGVEIIAAHLTQRKVWRPCVQLTRTVQHAFLGGWSIIRFEDKL
jgi:hypothetical protein